MHILKVTKDESCIPDSYCSQLNYARNLGMPAVSKSNCGNSKVWWQKGRSGIIGSILQQSVKVCHGIFHGPFSLMIYLLMVIFQLCSMAVSASYYQRVHWAPNLTKVQPELIKKSSLWLAMAQFFWHTVERWVQKKKISNWKRVHWHPMFGPSPINLLHFVLLIYHLVV